MATTVGSPADVVPTAGATFDPRELDSYLRARLPDYLVPSYLISLPKLPLTAVGKLARDALPDPVASVAGRDRTRPQTRLEHVIAGMWAEVLGLPEVGADESFFSLGGHSLLAVRAVARLSRELAADVPLALLFAHPTVAGLAAALSSQQHDQAGDAQAQPALAIPTASAAAGVSAAQQRMWFLDRLDPGNPRYHVPMAYRLRGPLRVEHLDEALALVVRRHDPLRTRILTDVSDEPYPAVDPMDSSVLDAIDVSHAPDPLAAGHEQVLAAIGAPFDLAAEPPFRALLVSLTPQDHLLAMVVHHIAFDGWSRRILLTELAKAYAGVTAGQGSDLAPLPVSYADYAAQQQERWHGALLDREVDHWRVNLAGASGIAQPRAGPAKSARPASSPGAVRPQRRGNQRVATAGRGQQCHHVHGAARRVRRRAGQAFRQFRGRRRDAGRRPVVA